MAKSNRKYITCEQHNPKADLCFEKIEGESETVSGEAYTITELMDRHLNMNVQDGVNRELFFEDTEDFQMPDLSKLSRMDIYDRYAIYGEIQDRARIAQKKIDDYNKTQEEIEKETQAKIAAYEAEQEDFLKWKQSQSTVKSSKKADDPSKKE